MYSMQRRLIWIRTYRQDSSEAGFIRERRYLAELELLNHRRRCMWWLKFRVPDRGSVNPLPLGDG
jgi:hypothetical protein